MLVLVDTDHASITGWYSSESISESINYVT